MVRGAQSAITIGTYRMRMWFVGCWVLRAPGQRNVAHFMDLNGGKTYGWIVSTVLGARPLWRNVHMVDGETTMMCVLILTMLECTAYQSP